MTRRRGPGARRRAAAALALLAIASCSGGREAGDEGARRTDSSGTAPATLPAHPVDPARPWRRAEEGYRYEFPRDHGAHPAFATEWWYMTGHLDTPSGRRYGFQITFFRVGLEPPDSSAADEAGSAWRLDTALLAHFALSDLAARTHQVAERRNRPGPGTAHAAIDSLDLALEDWSMRQEDAGIRVRASGGPAAIDLVALPRKPPVVHGAGGISRKAREPGRASHYVSFTRMAVNGTLSIEGRPLPVTGTAWMDHEFGSDQLGAGQTGWDWVGLSLDDGSEIMAYRLRGPREPFLQGTLVAPSGESTPLGEGEIFMEPGALWQSPQSGARYPVAWTIEAPGALLRLDVRARFPDQELLTPGSTGVTYWEGSAGATGSRAGRPVEGEGYLEMTGYAGAFEPKI